MADAAAARREARRKRILENSQNRLQLISGKVGDESPRESPTKSSNSEQNCEAPASTSNNVFCLPPVFNGAVVSEAESYDLLSAPHDSVAAGDNEIANDLAALLSSVPAPEAVQMKPLLEKIITYKYDVVIMALLNQLIYSIYTFETAYFFLPLIVYTVTKLIWFPTQTKSNIANAFLLLNGMSASRVQSILNLSQWISEISQDVCVYLFITICIQSVLITLNNVLT